MPGREKALSGRISDDPGSASRPRVLDAGDPDEPPRVGGVELVIGSFFKIVSESKGGQGLQGG